MLSDLMGGLQMVFPAYAGMSPRTPTATGPARGFPAYAGMSPARSAASSNSARFPRLRGDEPAGGADHLVN